MTTIPNGPYHFYTDRKLPPLVVEVFYGYVYECGEPHPKLLGQYRGEFVRLQEVTTVEPNQATHGDTTQG